jgi:hypothetical protein
VRLSIFKISPQLSRNHDDFIIVSAAVHDVQLTKIAVQASRNIAERRRCLPSTSTHVVPRLRCFRTMTRHMCGFSIFQISPQLSLYHDDLIIVSPAGYDVQLTKIAVQASRNISERRRCLPSTTHFLKAMIETMCGTVTIVNDSGSVSSLTMSND